MLLPSRSLAAQDFFRAHTFAVAKVISIFSNHSQAILKQLFFVYYLFPRTKKKLLQKRSSKTFAKLIIPYAFSFLFSVCKTSAVAGFIFSPFHFYSRCLLFSIKTNTASFEAFRTIISTKDWLPTPLPSRKSVLSLSSYPLYILLSPPWICIYRHLISYYLIYCALPPNSAASNLRKVIYVLLLVH